MVLHNKKHKCWLCAGFGDTMPFNYFTFGAACSEVELDTLTGDFIALRTHICMDVGSSLNPAIDIGQVEGGFVQVCCKHKSCHSSKASVYYLSHLKCQSPLRVLILLCQVGAENSVLLCPFQAMQMIVVIHQTQARSASAKYLHVV